MVRAKQTRTATIRLAVGMLLLLQPHHTLAQDEPSPSTIKLVDCNNRLENYVSVPFGERIKKSPVVTTKRGARAYGLAKAVATQLKSTPAFVLPPWPSTSLLLTSPSSVS